MSDDISKILRDWNFVPGEINARTVPGDDGREKIQLRLDLGVLQLEIDGRPDGRRVEGHESWLDFYRDRQQEHDRENPDAAPFMLEADDCQNLLREGIQYYHRYLSFWHLSRYEQCARDTNRNLRLLAFVREFARRPQDKLQFDQWRPYITMMHARAVAAPLVELDDLEPAIKAIEDKFIPATIGLDEPDEECDLDYTPNVGRKRDVNHAMSNSFAFGGLNAVLVFGPAPA